ncbi:hypothetical protein FRB94_010110, partial [Tulasnella sp. JGI-2019a]
KNAEGQDRFLVWHDQGRKPYQDAPAPKGAEPAHKLLLGGAFQGIVGQINALGEAYVGDYSKTF